jgi:peptide/nickel transport system substrate-binding protein
MSKLSRRQALALGLALPMPALAQADPRPVVTVAVQKISNTNSLEPLREQSNVGERIFHTSLFEGLIGRNYQGQLESVPMLATSWRRIDERTVEFTLREGVKFHNGETMTAEQSLEHLGELERTQLYTFAPQGGGRSTTRRSRSSSRTSSRAGRRSSRAPSRP